jgi:hypothetical protein
MAQTRLTNATRDSITASLVVHAFTDRSNAQLLCETDLAQEIYDHVMKTKKVTFEGSSCSLGFVVGKLPMGWESQHDNFKCEIAGSTMKFDKYDGMEESYRQNKQLVGIETIDSRKQTNWKFPPKWGCNATIAVFDARSDYANRATSLHDSRNDLIAEIASARSSARATMNSVTSIEKLIAIWPEVESFAAPFMNPKKAAAAILPVVAREKLNEALGLPAGEMA